MSLKTYARVQISGSTGKDIYDQPKAGLSGNTVGCRIYFDSRSAAYQAVMHSAHMHMDQQRCAFCVSKLLI